MQAQFGDISSIQLNKNIYDIQNSQNTATKANNSIFDYQNSEKTVLYGNYPPDIDVTDNRQENEDKSFWDNICDFFKGIFGFFKKPEWEINEEDGVVEVKHNEDGKSTSRSFEAFDEEEYEVNGELDMEIQQGQMEDCGLISICNSISQSEEGKELIKSAISTNYDDEGNIESYNVYFKGLDETYTVSASEMDEAYEKTVDEIMDYSKCSYSRGDKDMLLLELAWSKCSENSEKLDKISSDNIIRITNTDMPEGLSNVNQTKFYKAFCGNEFNEKTDKSTNEHIVNMEKEKESEILDLLKKTDTFKVNDLVNDEVTKGIKVTSEDKVLYEFNINDTYKIMDIDSENMTYKNQTTGNTYTIDIEEAAEALSGLETKEKNEFIFENEYKLAQESDVKVFNSNMPFTVVDTKGNKQEIVQWHCYSIKSMDDDTITLVNPHDTSKDIVVSKKELEKQSETGFYFTHGNLDK